MSCLVSVDPGLRQLGLAVFVDGRLVTAELVKNPEKTARGPKAWRAMAEAVEAVYWNFGLTAEPPDTYVVETMQYDSRTRRARVDDLFQLYGVGMYLIPSLVPVEVVGYYPSAWKGSVPGDIFVERIRGRLTPAEVQAIKPCAKSLEHNVLDGIGLGLFHLGRL